MFGPRAHGGVGNTSLNLDVRKRPLNWFDLLPWLDYQARIQLHLENANAKRSTTRRPFPFNILASITWSKPERVGVKDYFYTGGISDSICCMHKSRKENEDESRLFTFLLPAALIHLRQAQNGEFELHLVNVWLVIARFKSFEKMSCLLRTAKTPFTA